MKTIWITPGQYIVREVQPTGYVNVGDSDGGNLNEIVIDVSREDSTQLLFVDELPSVLLVLAVYQS
jgi:hypothetical protein